MWSPGFDLQAGGGQAAVDQVGPVLDLLQLALDDADQARHVRGGEVGDRPLKLIVVQLPVRNAKMHTLHTNIKLIGL